MKTKSQYYFDMAKESVCPSEIAKYMYLGFQALLKEMSNNRWNDKTRRQRSD